MGGFFGAVSNRDIVLDVYFGVDYHSHLGTKRAGMAVCNGEGGFQREIHSIENTPFRTKFEKDLEACTHMTSEMFDQQSHFMHALHSFSRLLSPIL